MNEESTSNKKHAHFLKVYIKADNVKLNFPPIPLIFIRGILSIILPIIKIVFKSKKDKFNEQDLEQFIPIIKLVMKELRDFPPFTLVEVEAQDAHVLIKTK